MTTDESLWLEFLRTWPISRLRTMTLPEYSTAGDHDTFTSWVESRLNHYGSMSRGSAIKFGICSRADDTEFENGRDISSDSKYSWYTKFGSTADEAFTNVRAEVVRIAEAARNGRWTELDSSELDDAYTWKIAFHYQARSSSEIPSIFAREPLLAALGLSFDDRTTPLSTLYQNASRLRASGENILSLSARLWKGWVMTNATPTTSPEVSEPRPRQLDVPLNQILFGPPGTGKTYHTITKALEILDPEFLQQSSDDRSALKQRFDTLTDEGRIAFVTFHQSYRYEDFVEGVRAKTYDENGTFRDEISDGVFKRLCMTARALHRSTESTNPEASRCVLIIDEINRGNVSRIFGEVISLIEPSKREGAPEAVKTTLPYSHESFSVPGNIHIIGTMNTADRSLAGLDLALRRRFAFVEMPPRPDLLRGRMVAGVDIGSMLDIMNQRIEVLLDRDHQLGHAYFLTIQDGDPLSKLEIVFRNQIIPLLQEYFFDDWQRIVWVLNDHRKAPQFQFLQRSTTSSAELFGNIDGVPAEAKRWRVNDAAFTRSESYTGIVQA